MIDKNNNRVLLIEADQDLAESICITLRLASYEVRHAMNGEQGLEFIKQFRPHLILCDVMMPKLDGYGVLHIVSNDLELRNTPFIFLSAKAEVHDFRTGMNMGADDYIAKPFSELDLLKVIDIRLKKSKDRDRNVKSGGTTPANPQDLENLLLQKHIRSYGKKELIFMEGQTSFGVYYVISGSIKTFKKNYEGKELITGIYEIGGFFGYNSILEEKPHHETAEVCEEAEISIIPKFDFLELIYNNRSFAEKFFKLMSGDLTKTENRLLEIAYQTVRERVACVLVTIGRPENHAERCQVITTSRKDISNLIGTTIESLNRTLADFKQEGVLEICNEGLRILSTQKLKRIAKMQQPFQGHRVRVTAYGAVKEGEDALNNEAGPEESPDSKTKNSQL